MDAISAIREMMKFRNFSIRAIGEEMHKSPLYMNGILYRGSIPKADTYAAIASACGYDLFVRNREDGTEIAIDPPNDDE